MIDHAGNDAGNDQSFWCRPDLQAFQACAKLHRAPRKFAGIEVYLTLSRKKSNNTCPAFSPVGTVWTPPTMRYTTMCPPGHFVERSNLDPLKMRAAILMVEPPPCSRSAVQPSEETN